jgi:hypothetical protein
MDRDRGRLEQLGDTHHRVPHHRAADVIGMEVGGEGTGESHAVTFERLEDRRDVIGGVDHDRLAGGSITDQIDEVDHLTSDHVVATEVSTREQLAEVQTILHRLIVGSAARRTTGTG